MALIKCIDCGKEISDKAKTCPNCGCPVSESILTESEQKLQEMDKEIERLHAIAEYTRKHWCKKCHHPKVKIVGDDVATFGICEKCGNVELVFVSDKEKFAQLTKQPEAGMEVRCPYCNSTNVKKIGLGGRMLSVGTLGLAGSKIGKQWHCNSCKSDF